MTAFPGSLANLVYLGRPWWSPASTAYSNLTHLLDVTFPPITTDSGSPLLPYPPQRIITRAGSSFLLGSPTRIRTPRASICLVLPLSGLCVVRTVIPGFTLASIAPSIAPRHTRPITPSFRTSIAACKPIPPFLGRPSSIVNQSSLGPRSPSRRKPRRLMMADPATVVLMSWIRATIMILSLAPRCYMFMQGEGGIFTLIQGSGCVPPCLPWMASAWKSAMASGS